MEVFLISSRNGPMGRMRASSSSYNRSLAGLASNKASCVASHVGSLYPLPRTPFPDREPAQVRDGDDTATGIRRRPVLPGPGPLLHPKTADPRAFSIAARTITSAQA